MDHCVCHAVFIRHNISLHNISLPVVCSVDVKAVPHESTRQPIASARSDGLSGQLM